MIIQINEIQQSKTEIRKRYPKEGGEGKGRKNYHTGIDCTLSKTVQLLHRTGSISSRGESQKLILQPFFLLFTSDFSCFSAVEEDRSRVKHRSSMKEQWIYNRETF